MSNGVIVCYSKQQKKEISYELKNLLNVFLDSLISIESKRLVALRVSKEKFILKYWGYDKFKNNQKEARKEVFNLIKEGWIKLDHSKIIVIFSQAKWELEDSFFTVTFSEPFFNMVENRQQIGFKKLLKDFSIINSNYIKNDKGTHVIKLVFKLFSWTKDKGEFQRFISFEEMKEILGISQNSYLSRGKFSPSLFNNLVLKPSFKKIEKFGEFSNINVEIDNKKRVFLIRGKRIESYKIKSIESCLLLIEGVNK